jgi:hypothetical protein
MLFNLERDDGDIIEFYLAPDAHSEIPRVTVFVDGAEAMEFPANELRDAMRIAGRHESGLCGFRIDSAMIPNLAAVTDLEVIESESNLLIYRRCPATPVAKKVLRLEPRLLPMLGFERSVKPHFQYYARQIENYGLESATQMFTTSIASIYLSGRINFKNFEYYVDSVFDPVVFLNAPHVMLAERLLVLAKLHQAGKLAALSARDAMLLAPAAAFAAALDLTDGRALRRALKDPPQEVAVALVNPLTRLLTTKAPDEMPRTGALASALDVLARFAVVGIETDARGFRDAFAQHIGRPADTIEVAEVPGAVRHLAHIIETEAHAEALMDYDLDIYATVRDAHQQAMSAQSGTGRLVANEPGPA